MSSWMLGLQRCQVGRSPSQVAGPGDPEDISHGEGGQGAEEARLGLEAGGGGWSKPSGLGPSSQPWLHAGDGAGL